jgi:hypothetical protein
MDGLKKFFWSAVFSAGYLVYGAMTGNSSIHTMVQKLTEKKPSPIQNEVAKKPKRKSQLQAKNAASAPQDQRHLLAKQPDMNSHPAAPKISEMGRAPVSGSNVEYVIDNKHYVLIDGKYYQAKADNIYYVDGKRIFFVDNRGAKQDQEDDDDESGRNPAQNGFSASRFFSQTSPNKENDPNNTDAKIEDLKKKTQDLPLTASPAAMLEALQSAQKNMQQQTQDLNKAMSEE